ncbi:MAG: hypothetical protein EOM30_09970 [Clostridia bacterium]|nr:hypothetical protein [Clostridia bacterium]NLS85425.1 hypothetical protein [Oscillospiraceae bacterium]
MAEQTLATVEEKDDLQSLLKKQMFWTKLCAIACVGIFAVVLICAVWLAPQVSTALDSINSVAVQFEEIDWDALVTNINKLAATGQGSMADISNALGKLDIDGLNQAISDLQKAISPLAKLFGG